MNSELWRGFIACVHGQFLTEPRLNFSDGIAHPGFTIDKEMSRSSRLQQMMR